MSKSTSMKLNLKIENLLYENLNVSKSTSMKLNLKIENLLYENLNVCHLRALGFYYTWGYYYVPVVSKIKSPVLCRASWNKSSYQLRHTNLEHKNEQLKWFAVSLPFRFPFRDIGGWGLFSFEGFNFDVDSTFFGQIYLLWRSSIL